MNRRAYIGFDRRVDVVWLDAAAGQAAAGATPPQMRSYLWKLLEGSVAGDKSNSARGKTVTVLSHIWGDVPAAAVGLRQRASALVGDCTADERLALHWAMMVATYPVFADVASATGRLITLQGSFTLAHLARRLAENWGERSTLERAAQRIVRSMVEWGALRDMKTRGMYEASPTRRKIGPEIAPLFLEALLIAGEHRSMPLDQLGGHSALFPFGVRVNTRELRASTQFRVHRQGLDTDFVELA